MKGKHLQRLEREAGLPGLLEALSQKLSPTDLQSLLLEVYRRRTQVSDPPQVLRRYRDSRFTRPSPLDPRSLHRLQGLLWQNLPDEVVPLELSPLAPLGNCSVLAPCDQNKVVATVRNLEVAADTTNQLALEAALRRRCQSEVHLAAFQRVTRAQFFGNVAEFYAHFSLFGMVSSGRRPLSFLRLHIDYYQRLLAHFELPELRISVTPLDPVGERWFASLQSQLPGLELDRERESGRGYYQHLCFKIYSQQLDLGDGGFTDWTQQLLGNRRERLLISGLGGERLAARL